MATYDDGGLIFDIPEADRIFRFDSNRTHELYAQMEKVDLIAECEEYDIYIENKEPDNPYNATFSSESYKKMHNGEWANEVVGQFRETFLYRWGQGIDKPVRFVLVITGIEPAYLMEFLNNVAAILPRTQPPSWSRHYLEQLTAVSLETCIDVHPSWTLSRSQAAT